MMRQLHFAMLDLELHAHFKPGGKETASSLMVLAKVFVKLMFDLMVQVW